MKIINHHLGLPVICLDTSERVGDVLRFITDQVAGKIVAVAVAGEWYQEPSGVAVEDCTAFGQNVILVNRRDSVRPLSEMDTVRMHLQASNDARQRTAITESGRLLGSITDEAFDEKTGEVTGYRLDILADSGAGRTVYVPHTTFMTASATVAILKDDVLDAAAPTLEALQEGSFLRPAEPVDTDTSPGAFAGAESLSYGASPEHAVEEMEAVGYDSTQPEQDEPREPNREQGYSGSVGLEAAGPAPSETAMDPAVVALSESVMDEGPAPAAAQPADAMEAQERVMLALVIGKSAGATVTDDDGRTILEQGQLITMEIAHAVRAAGKLYEVWMAAQEEA